MGLSAGERLGPYEVVGPIGKGGMGEVYRARDTTLGRDVAIKVLPEDFSADEERVARFRREAQVLASLNHPNIAAIYGTEQNALVLELVEGPTLAERVAQGPIPLDEAIAIARQIAEALEAAHEAGVIHRDLKPANVKVQEDGTVKVLDFGLAKAVEGEKEGDASESPTLTGAATRAGIILGTAAYMSPEQAKGKQVDKRADVWSFGAVLYEMLTGKRPFIGEDVSDTLAAVLRAEPEWDALPAELSPTLRTYLLRCLEKDPKQRIPDVGVVRLALAGALDASVVSSDRVAEQPARPSIAIALASALSLSALTGVAVWNWKPEPPRVLTRFVIDTPSAPASILTSGLDVAMSWDGTRLVYRAAGASTELWVRAVDELEGAPIAGLGRNPGSPFISPDGNWVGYFESGGNALLKVSITGGPPVTICELIGGTWSGASWGDNNEIVFASSETRGLQVVAAGGGEPQQLTAAGSAADHLWPEFLPGGEAVLFTVREQGQDVGDIALVTLDSGETRVLVPGGSNPRYAPTGHIVYGSQGTLRAVGFDLDRLEVTSDPVPVLERVSTKFSGATNIAISQNGSLFYARGPEFAAVERTLVWVDRAGNEEPLSAEPRAYAYPRISPDGSRVALDVRDQEQDIWIWDFARETLTRLTFATGSNIYPAWTPDGRHVVYGLNGNPNSLVRKAADGTGSVELLDESTGNFLPQSFSPDGTHLIVVLLNPGGGRFNIGVRSMDADGTVEPLVATEFDEMNAELSPDGAWLAYQSDASGRHEIYVRPFPNVEEGRWQISSGGGAKPLWAPDGRELFYLASDGRLMAVPVTTDPFAPGNPEVVFEQTYIASGGAAGGIGVGRTYDISPDGKRFLMIQERSGDETEPPQLILVQNWLDELKRLVPVDH